MLKNRVLRRIFGPKRYEVTGEYGKLPAEITSVVFTKRNENAQVIWDDMGRPFSMWGEEECCRILMGETSRKNATRKT
jgi:hypothetical protein